MDREALEVVGTIGDVNPLDYGGGIVYRDKVGALSLEWYEPEDEDNEDSPITCYRVDLDHGAESWMALGAVAKTCDESELELRAAFDSPDPVRLAHAFWSVAMYHGWHNLDSDPLTLTRAEAEARIV